MFCQGGIEKNYRIVYNIVKGGDKMTKLSKDTKAYANKKEYIKKYRKENYEQITLTVPKGTREKIKKWAALKGLSISIFLITAAESWMSKTDCTE